MSDSRSRLFAGWDPASSAELTARQAGATDRHSRQFHDSSGALVRIELYRRDELVEVDYFVGDLASVSADHLRDYPGIDFALVRAVAAPAGFEWVITARYAADGALRNYITELTDPRDSLLMSLEYDANGGLRLITKFWDELPDQAGMLFEYGPEGHNYLTVDLQDGGTLKFADVLGALEQPDFYADGFALPPQVAGAPVPSPLDHFER